VTGASLIIIGASWGGFDAVSRLLKRLSADLQAAVVVVLHRGPSPPEATLARSLQAWSALPTSEVEDKDEIVSGRVYVAPADYHLLVEDGHFELSIDAPVSFSRPSIDVLFTSAAHELGPRLVGVVLTGANSDGSEGLRRIKEHGGLTLVQEPRTAERPDMPAAAIATGAVDRVLTIDEIAEVLNEVGRAR
jgi:two-component system, chemotaxis family, protein-glutamate methylesterase/glutaminase